MSQVSDIKEQINDLTTFKHIASAFTEAAAAKLASIRRAFERNDRFYDDITHIYNLVKINAQRSQNLKKTQNQPALKNLSVALTSNQRFFGTINNEIMASFLEFSDKKKNEKLVIGTTGENYIKGSFYEGSYQKMIFASDIPNPEETRLFLDKIKSYNQITIFFPKFISFLKQTIGVIDITTKIPMKQQSTEQDKEEFNLIFEPELSKMEDFFDNQVRLILFRRVILETDLARTAARLLTMSQAEERSDFEIRSKKSELRKVSASITNAQLLETFSGIKKWKHSMSDRRTLTEMKNKVLFFDTPDQNIS